MTLFRISTAALLAACEPMTPLELRKMFDDSLAPDTLPMVIQLNKGEQRAALTDAAAAKRLLGHRADVHIVPANTRAGVGVVETVMQLLTVVWPALVHEHEVLAASELDLATLLRELGRTLNVGEQTRTAGEPRVASDDAGGGLRFSATGRWQGGRRNRTGGGLGRHHINFGRRRCCRRRTRCPAHPGSRRRRRSG